ncbi:MAG: type II toxin-antitoxin system Phd/YefM family antitoxin [Planctomycetes bacterium]|nr:type II toxin-antitoxin system Phd/YefM family antitoxin [Planctomycetota bacterium]
MKFVQVNQAKASLSSFLKICQDEHVVITKHGKLCAVLTGVQGYDLEDLMTAADPGFWKMIEARRRNPGRGLTLEAAREHFAKKDAQAAAAERKGARKARPGVRTGRARP